MDYQFEELTDIKLIIMKTIQYFKEAIPENILSDVILTRGYANFFDISQAVYELGENRLITHYDDKNGRFYSLTRLGETALESFSGKLPRSVCEKLYQTVRMKIREYENDLSILADYERDGDMGYKLKLGIAEGGYEIFTVALSIFDEKMAKDICREFKHSPQTLYSEILSTLIKE